MIKIAWILHGSYENEGRVYKESQTMTNAGYQVTIFATWKKGLPSVQQEGNVKIERLAFPVLSMLKVPLYKAKLLMPFYTLKLILKLCRYKADIIHCMNFWTLHIGYISKKLFNVPYVYDSHDLFIGQIYMNNKPAIIRRLHMVYEKFFAKRAAVVLQTTEFRSEQFRKFYGVKAEVIMNKALTSTSKKKALKTNDYPALKTPKNKLVYVGSILAQRGIEQLVKATLGMNDIQIFVLGRVAGPWGYNLLNKYKEWVSWIPPVDPAEVSDALKVFDLGVSLIQNSCLSYYLSCPTKVWELIASGTPQIASDFPEIRKVVIDNEVGPVGRVVDPADVDQIRRNIQEMLSGPQEVGMYRRNCLRLRELYTWEVEGKKLVNLYDSLMSG